MEFLLIPTLAFVAVTSVGSSLLLSRSLRRRPILDRLREGASPEAPSSGVQETKGWATTIARTLGLRVTNATAASRLQQELATAGYFRRDSAQVYLGLKLMLLLLSVAGLTIALTPLKLPLPAKVALILCGGGVSFLIPNLVVRSRVRMRCLQIRHHLPYALDLLEICVSSGMGMDMAWNSVADEMRRVSPTLADEMALTTLEIHLGASRATAMRHMAQRTRAEELSSLVTILVQSERFGTSIADALRTFAASMLDTRMQYAKEAAEKLAVKMVLPMVLFIFPSLLIIMVGPAAISLSHTLAG